MRAEILSIGTELLLGQIIDTNAAYIAQRLAEVGIMLHFKDTVGDNEGRLTDTLQLACRRSEFIICTGGLGPTEDDITSAVIARVFSVPLELDEEAQAHVKGFFDRVGRPLSANQLKQAYLPLGSRIIPNPVGTAPGFILERPGMTVIALPGPPPEMHAMWRETVGPYLRERSSTIVFSRTLRFCGIGEGPLAHALGDLIAAQKAVTIAPYAKTGEVHIRLTVHAQSEAESRSFIAPLEQEIRRRFPDNLYGVDEETLEEVVGRMLRERGWTLAVAESCTGGLLGARLTNVPGSSDYFLGGVVAYSNALKAALLSVPEQTLATHGAVSEETARLMADGVCALTKADVGMSITGIAGPGGGTDEKPVGLVYIGLGGRVPNPTVQRILMGGDREVIRARSAQEALALLWRALREGGTQ